jgi:tRNA(Ile)-lysidine synthase
MSTTVVLSKVGGAWPLARWRNVTVLVAVSGGSDSVALLRALAQLHGDGAGRLVIAHFNHRLRGAESDGDQDFVERLGHDLGLEVVVGSAAEASVPTEHVGHARQSPEGTARQARYDFLKQAASEGGARYVVTAHTADDQVETVLHHILRGTGLTGLAGISAVRRLTEATTLVRPMLTVTRSEVLAYLQSLQQAFREDTTNRAEHFTRNRIRHSLLPLLESEYNPRVRDAIARLAQTASQADEFLTQEAESLLATVASPVSSGVALNLPSLVSVHPSVIRQCFLTIWRQQGWPQQAMSQEKWTDLVALVQASSADSPSPQMYPGGIRVEKVGTQLRLILGT